VFPAFQGVSGAFPKGVPDYQQGVPRVFLMVFLMVFPACGEHPEGCSWGVPDAFTGWHSLFGRT